MKRTTVLSTLAIALASTAASAQLVITEVLPQTTSGTPSAINGDWWELTNASAAPINLAGYQWADTEDALPSADSNFFPSIVINPGQSIVILEETAASLDAWRANWGLADSVVVLTMDQMLDDSTPDGDTFSGLGSSNDGVFLYDNAGNLLSSYLYAATTRGTSFQIDALGNFLGLSVAGEHGAVAAVNGDIGSPGFAVPAPGAASLLAVGGAGTLLAARRRR